MEKLMGALKQRNDELTEQFQRSRIEFEERNGVMESIRKEMTEREEDLRKQLGSSAETITLLKQRISDLMERENLLNRELEQTKESNESCLRQTEYGDADVTSTDRRSSKKRANAEGTTYQDEETVRC